MALIRLVSNKGVDSRLIERLGGIVVAEHAVSHGTETLVEAHPDDIEIIGELTYCTVRAAGPVEDGWFADDNGGGAIITDNGTRWEQAEQEPDITPA